MLLGLFDCLKCILPLATTVTDEIICKETDLLEKLILQMFEVMQKVAKFLCNYVRHGRQLFGLLDRA